MSESLQRVQENRGRVGGLVWEAEERAISVTGRRQGEGKGREERRKVREEEKARRNNKEEREEAAEGRKEREQRHESEGEDKAGKG